ncbi:HAD-superfamily hydrolase, subfamily IIA, CECR5 [Corchorus capsularis]|uniref:HAD-superfamily hydrolase, subfamily IIA, CECR5 n=1 Tax=Corchorus capsularis TaxID=210143 RepID=A0A1R3HBF0_COCAP|nr:HAD-superfamily hydrolase, subfamily IIA, CECR5 [Corchorus capsularis]
MISLQMSRKTSQIQSRKQLWRLFSTISLPSSQQAEPPSFGIAFDIDGVVLRGSTPIGGATKALRRLYDDYGVLKIPFIFLTNGGGVRESKRAAELSEFLGVKISPLQVVQGHSPFKQMVNRFENELIVAVGKGEPATVMSEYGFKNVISIDEYALCFDNIDPLAPYKKWSTMEAAVSSTKKSIINSARVQAAFVVSDSVDWSRDVQVLCDILRTGGLPGSEEGPQPPLFFAHDDLKYQGAFSSERFGMGAFRIALESIFNSIHTKALTYASVGKPNPVAFKNAEVVLKQLASSLHHDLTTVDHANSRSHDFQKLYMIGDNPLVDIKGARQAGHPWFPILTRTGVFKGDPHSNHAEFPANLVVDTVEDAVNFILRNELIKS